MDAVPLSGRCRLFWRAASEDEHEKVLFKFDIRHFDKNILEMSLEELRQHFGYKTSMRIRITILIRNIIWQTYEYIQAGSPPDFYRRREYIRALWYYIKKKTTQHRATQGNHYSVVSDQLLLMVKAGLFAYREEMADLYGCHVITLGGSPSYFSNNTMVAEMHELGVPMDQEFMVFTIVDFDPAGWNAAEEFVKQLQDSPATDSPGACRRWRTPTSGPHLPAVSTERVQRTTASSRTSSPTSCCARSSTGS